MAVIKRSITLRGHRTSVSLEDLFWDILCSIALSRGQSLASLVAEIDDNRARALMAGVDAGGLSSVLRVYVLEALLSGFRVDSISQR